MQSSPGYLQVGQVKSNWTRQIPQTSSSGISQRHDATASHCLILTFMIKQLGMFLKSPVPSFSDCEIDEDVNNIEGRQFSVAAHFEALG